MVKRMTSHCVGEHVTMPPYVAAYRADRPVVGQLGFSLGAVEVQYRGHSLKTRRRWRWNEGCRVRRYWRMDILPLSTDNHAPSTVLRSMQASSIATGSLDQHGACSGPAGSRPAKPGGENCWVSWAAWDACWWWRCSTRADVLSRLLQGKQTLPHLICF